VRFPRIAFNHRQLGDVFGAIHEYGRWVVYGLIAVHIAGVCYHVTVRRDRLLDRILPPQTIACSGSVAKMETSGARGVEVRRSKEYHRLVVPR
jgi:hypothetical protein